MRTLKIDFERLARDVAAAEAELSATLLVRLPKSQRAVLLRVARREYGSSVQRLLRAAIDQIISHGENNPSS